MGCKTPYSLSRRVPSATRPPLLEDWRLYASTRDPTWELAHRAAGHIPVRDPAVGGGPRRGSADRARGHRERRHDRDSVAAAPVREWARPFYTRARAVGRPERRPERRLQAARRLQARVDRGL